MTERNDMPKRIWAWIDGHHPHIEMWRVEGSDLRDENRRPSAEEAHGVEYIRADNLPDVDVEDIAHRVQDAAFEAYGVIIDPVWLERILRKALEVHSD